MLDSPSPELETEAAAEIAASEDEGRALNALVVVIEQLGPLDTEQRRAVLRAVEAFYGTERL